MTDAKPPDPPQTANSSPQTADLNAEADTAAKGERLGTILMAVAIGAVIVLVIDVAMRGKLLAPLFALLPAPKPPATEEPGAETRPAGE